MKRWSLLKSSLWLLVGLCGCGHVSANRGCELRLQQDPADREMIHFSGNEKLLVCGDQGLDGWENIPVAQVERQLRVFLEERGYFSPSFRLDHRELIFRTGDATKIGEIHFLNAPADFHGERFRGTQGQNLGCSTLNDIQGWALGRLRRLGYACGKIEAVGSSTTGDVQVHIQPGPLMQFPNVHLINGFGTDESAIRRFDAFRTGDPFDSRLLDLSNSRIEGSGTVVSAVLPYHCETNGLLKVENGIVPGERRLIQAGVGVTTEEFPIARLIWKNVRLGQYASTLFAKLYASPLHELMQVGWEGHVFSNSQRSALLPQLSFENWNERDLKGYEFKTPMHISQQWELARSSVRMELGPSVSFQNFGEGVRTGVHLEPIYEGSLEWTSHDAEIYAQDPRQGAQVHLNGSALSTALGSSTDVGLITLGLSQLWNLGELEPPAWVLGTRLGFMSVLTRGGDGSDPNLPSTFSVVMGGDQDLRGFGRRELPGAGQLSLSGVSWGTELRRSNWLPERIEPFLFFDLGRLGSRSFSLNPTTFVAPGFGTRWQSPIGAVRASLAHGWALGEAPIGGRAAHEHFQLFVSLGKEF